MPSQGSFDDNAAIIFFAAISTVALLPATYIVFKPLFSGRWSKKTAIFAIVSTSFG
jgi:hypothetical protein